MKSLQQYHSQEDSQVHKLNIIGTPMSGKTTFLIHLNNAAKNLTFPPPFEKQEVRMELQTSYATCKCVFEDINIKDYSKATKEQWAMIVDCSVLLVFCDCFEATVQQALVLANKARQLKQHLRIFIIANKADEYEPNMINEKQLQQLAGGAGMLSCIISAKTGMSCDHLQFVLADLLLNPGQTYLKAEGKSGQPVAKKKSICNSQ